MRLIEARQTQSVGESFSLLFRTRVRGGIDGGIYRLEHPSRRLRAVRQPVGRGVKGQDIEAVIYRIAT